MSENTAKIRLKFGSLEVEYEGKESFLKDDLFDLLEKMVSIYKEHGATLHVDSPLALTNVTDVTDKDRKIDLSTATIASRINASTASDLVIAASAYLALSAQKDEFSRDEILKEMKAAKSFYKKSMLSNLSKTLKGLVSNNRLNQTVSRSYTLTASELKTMEQLLAKWS